MCEVVEKKLLVVLVGGDRLIVRGTLINKDAPLLIEELCRLAMERAATAREAVKARIAEAAKYVPLVQLCLSPQCGFSSTEEGNIMTEEEQWAKVRLVVEIAREVWQDA